VSVPPTRDRLRRWARRGLVEARWHAGLVVLPPQVAIFQARARRHARRTGDLLSLTSVTRPADLRALLALARGRRRVVELGTATGWTAISLALADPARRVTTLDVIDRDEPRRYLRLVGRSVRERIELQIRDGAEGPLGAEAVDLLYIDSSHEREPTIAELRAWRPALAPGATVVFDDYRHPHYPGVREAVSQLGLAGEPRGAMFVHTVPGRTTCGPAARRSAWSRARRSGRRSAW
jgi:predicted O-methyltransferase YrrM